MTNGPVLQNGPLMPDGQKTLTQEFDVHELWRESAPAEFLKQNGARFVALVTTGGVGADAKLIDALPNVKLIATRSVGYEKIDTARAKERGIIVTNTPDVLTDCVADLAFGGLISVARALSAADRYVRRGDWQRSGRFPLTTRVSGKHIGILGLGSIGRAIAKRARGFDMEVRYHNRREVEGVGFRYERSIADLARWADFLVVSVGGGAHTRGLVTRGVLDALGPKGYLINISRGSVVDEPALVEALVQKRIAGAALDVFANEPNVPAPLLELDNVVLFPHMASGTQETFKAMEDLVLDNLRSFLRDGTVLTPVS